jgi:hypothetical protein
MPKVKGEKGLPKEKTYLAIAKEDARQKENSQKNRKVKSIVNPIIISIIVVYVLIVIVYFMNYAPQKIQMSSLEKDKSILVKGIEPPTDNEIAAGDVDPSKNVVTFVIGNEVDKAKLKEFASMPYSELKKQLGIKNDFCIHFEDANGNLIDVSDLTGRQGIGIGSPGLEFTLQDQTGAAAGTVTC